MAVGTAHTAGEDGESQNFRPSMKAHQPRRFQERERATSGRKLWAGSGQSVAYNSERDETYRLRVTNAGHVRAGRRGGTGALAGATEAGNYVPRDRRPAHPLLDLLVRVRRMDAA